MSDNTQQAEDMSAINKDLINKLSTTNKIILQVIRDDGSYTVEYIKSINDLSKKLNIPYSTLINLYYICTNKGGGVKKANQKKYIHTKYIELLKRIRIFDSINEGQINNKEYFNRLMNE